MGRNNQVYIKLQKHLDNQAVGFPATRSGAELKILQHIFTPREAEIACCLSYKYESLETIFGRAGHLVESAGDLEKILAGIQQKGGLESKIENGSLLYCNAPLVVGMYEYQQNRLTPEFIEDFNEYTSTKNFGLAFLSSKLPQMRTIPVSKSMLRMQQSLPKPIDFWVSNFYAAVDRKTCTGCGACVKRCQVHAVSLSQKKQPVAVNPDRCIGCGVCVPACPTGSLVLVKKSDPVKPPRTREELHDIIMSGRKGRLGKLKLTGKLVVDSIRTGHLDLLK